MNKLHLEFDPKELDYIANCLARQPWQDVNALMVNIQNQITQQQGAQDARTSSSGGAEPRDAGQTGEPGRSLHAA